MNKEIINIQHIPQYILTSINNDEDDWEGMAEYLEIDEEDEWEGKIEELLEERSMVDRFFDETGLKYIHITEEVGDMEKSYWNKQIVFLRPSDGKYFAANYNESDYGYWGGFQEVKELREVERKERTEVYYE